MSDRDVIPDEMGWFSDMDDRELERLFAGRASAGNAEIDALAGFFDEVREAYPEVSTDELERPHVAAMIEAAHLLAENGEPAAMPASKARGPEEQASGLPKWRRTRMSPRGRLSVKWKVAFAAMAFVLLLGGTALAGEAGVLPGPIQDAVARAATVVGIDMPSSDDGNTNDLDQGDQTNVDKPNANETGQPDAGTVDQPNAGDADPPDAGNTDQPNAGNADQPDAGNVDQPDAGNTDQPNAGNADQPDAGNVDQPNAGDADQPNAGDADQGDSGGGGQNGQN